MIHQASISTDGWEKRYRRLISLGKGLAPLEDAYKTAIYSVPGCTAQVWLAAREEGGRFIFRADSDSLLVKGWLALLLDLYDGKTAENILAIDAEAFFASQQLEQVLTPSRSNGFFSIAARIRQLAHESATEGASQPPSPTGR